MKRARVRPSPTSRSVPEWVGRTPDSIPPPHVERRIFDSHDGCCHITGREIRPGDSWHLEHMKSLRSGGENKETNLAPALVAPHKVKTKQERAIGAKADHARNKHILRRKPKWPAMPCGRASKWKRKMNGELVLR